jgi:glutamate---[amino group carrier protein] ligase
METMERLVIVARNVGSTNRGLVGAARAFGLDAVVLTPEQAARRLRPGDVALGRLDVRPTLDGPERGLNKLRILEARGVVLNRAGALLAAHDKLSTALRLSARALPHPRTAHVDAPVDPAFGFPVVVKPRFGSWGRDVTVCRSRSELERCLRGRRRRRWFRRQGALVQELIPPRGYDVRILVAAGEIVGAVQRVAVRGEWRTNVALGGGRAPADPPPQARLIALGAAAALEADFVGVDLLPTGEGRWVVLEVNGAVDFTSAYSLAGENVFERVVRTLALSVRGEGGAREERFAGARVRAAAIAANAETAS